MTRSGILPDLFTLAEGKWTVMFCSTKGNRVETIESDGTKVINMREVRSAMAMPIERKEEKKV